MYGGDYVIVELVFDLVMLSGIEEGVYLTF
jgi:hypothetical protein